MKWLADPNYCKKASSPIEVMLCPPKDVHAAVAALNSDVRVRHLDLEPWQFRLPLSSNGQKKPRELKPDYD